MARIDSFNNYFTDVANAIRAKEGSTGVIPAAEFDTRIANLGGANGITENRKLDDSDWVYSGDFIGFSEEIENLTNYINSSITTDSSTYPGNGGAYVHLYDDIYFIAHNNDINHSGYTSGLQGGVYKVTSAIQMLLSSSLTSLVNTTGRVANKSILIKLTNEKILLVYSTGSSSYVYGRIIKINSDNSLTLGTNYTLINDSSAGDSFSILPISETKFTIVCGISSQTGLSTITGTISDTTITMGSIALVTNNNTVTPTHSKIIRCSKEYACVVYLKSGTMYCTMITLNDSSSNPITNATSPTTLTTNCKSYPMEFLQGEFLNYGKIIIAYPNTSGYLYGITFNVSGTNISSINEQTIKNNFEAGNFIKMVKLNRRQVLILYQASGGVVGGTIIKVDNVNGNIIEENNFSVSGSGAGNMKGCIQTSDGHLMILIGNSNGLFQMQQYVPKMKVGLNSRKYIGVAKADAIEGETFSCTCAYGSYASILLNTGENNNYGFELKDGYYTSKNSSVQNSYSKCRIWINAPEAVKIKIMANCYAESSYDYGIISNLNSSLLGSYTADSSYKSQIKSSSASSFSEVIIDVPAGVNFIELKYRKDGSQNKNNDNFKFQFYIEKS